MSYVYMIMYSASSVAEESCTGPSLSLLRLAGRASSRVARTGVEAVRSAPATAHENGSTRSEATGRRRAERQPRRTRHARQRPASDLRARSGTAGHEKCCNSDRLGPAGPSACQVETLVVGRRSSPIAGKARGERESAAAGPWPSPVRSVMVGDAKRRPPCTFRCETTMNHKRWAPRVNSNAIRNGVPIDGRDAVDYSRRVD